MDTAVLKRGRQGAAACRGERGERCRPTDQDLDHHQTKRSMNSQLVCRKWQDARKTGKHMGNCGSNTGRSAVGCATTQPLSSPPAGIR